MPYVWRCQISYNGSGTFNINTTGQPVVTGTVISSTAFNALTADLGTGLSTALTKDGQTVATARIPFAQGINSSLVTDATSTTTGSIITAGGVGIAKALYVGTTANIAGTTTLAGVTATSITDSGLTSGRVTYAGTAGLLQDSANLTFNGTTLTANTIGAFTLGGTVAGGGNQLNNVIIGTTTPLAGAFTTLSATTGVSVPNDQVYQFGGAGTTYIQGNAATPVVNVVVGGALRGAFSSTGLNSTAIGATTPSTGAFTTLSSNGDATLCKTSGNITAGYATSGGTLKLDIYDGSLTSTTIGANRVARIGSNVNGGDCTLQFTDSVTYNSYISAKANHLYIQPATAGTYVADFSSTGLAVTGTLSATTSITSIGSVGNVYTDSTGARLNFSRGADNYFQATTAGGYFAWIVNNTGTNAMTLDASGNLLVGGTTQSGTANRVAVFSANKFGLSVIDTTAQATGVGGALNLGGNYRSAGDAQAFARVAAAKENSTDANYAYAMTFSVTPNGGSFTEAGRFDSSGNLLVGATSQPVGTSRAVFSTTGNTQAAIFINDTFNYSSTINWNKATANNNYFVEFATEGTYTARGSITYNRAGGLTVYSTTSDYRLKEHIIDLPNALETVSRLKPRQFDWKETGNTTTGFIAHELAEVCPHAVTGEKDAVEMRQYEISPAVPATFDEEGNELTAAVEAVMGEREVPRYQGIDTSFLVATLTAAIQEQQAIITALTTRITALENK